ncbi:MAG: DUF2242 domain-containing protein [Desulfurella sp.]|uniref:DUF2242 domain-containing protein n=1 Tax=Desulfurella sp. TaxID=1962857 RepID=UPI003D13B506
MAAKQGKYSLLMLIFTIFIASCATNPYKTSLNSTIDNSKTFDTSAQKCYLASKAVLLKRGFLIEKDEPNAFSFVATRYFPSGKDSTVVVVNINVLQNSQNKSTVFISAMQYENVIRTTTQTTLLGLVPIGSTATTSKQSEKSITDKQFFDTFFKELSNELRQI